jgi:xylitol oxidase
MADARARHAHSAGVNWAGNHAYRSGAIHEPRTVDEVQELVRRTSAVRAIGTRHAFNDLPDSRGDLISLRRLPRRLEIDPAAATVTIDGGMTFGDLCGPLDAAGLRLHNLSSLPHLSVAGACATATHGSGNRNGTLATAVRALSLVRADGEIATFDTSSPDGALDGAIVGLGALGVVTSLTLAVGPADRMRQDVFEDVPFEVLNDRFDAISASGDSVSWFTDWSGPAFHQVWVKRRVGAGIGDDIPALGDAQRATVAHHPIPGLPAEACTPQLGSVGPWHERLPHFRLDHRPSAGAELQSEYLMARSDAPAALEALAAIAHRLSPATLVSEVRTIAGDRHWLSPCAGRETVAFHFTWVPDWAVVEPLLAEVERALDPFAPRPHWGKLFAIPAEELRARYPDRDRFVALARSLDPNGTFRNPFVDGYVFGEGDSRPN